MKRFHVHVAVEDQQSIRFYSTLFAAESTVLKLDYATWMLDDPRVTLAISQRCGAPGVDHLGIQAKDEAELAEVYAHLSKAERPVLEEAATCCYARSDKQSTTGPQGVAWETFLTFGEAAACGYSRATEPVAGVHAEAADAPCCMPPAAIRRSCGCGVDAAVE
ncbi:MAG TPA: glyoxalase/bleomycin resistance/dioxygenase family protein [Alphaproteobacteria bacterium]|nr:glyoxalase/bleomycin resistance/dioxygenase family protein [Alphaproteobacteria bacterium]